jgi:TM2 domain-containing membrane protein YozV
MATPEREALLRPRTHERHAIVAFWLTVVLTGLGHLYAGERARGLLLLVSELVALNAIGSAGVPVLTPFGVALWVAFFAYGAIDAVKAVRPGMARPPGGVFWLFPAIAVATVIAALAL